MPNDDPHTPLLFNPVPPGEGPRSGLAALRLRARHARRGQTTQPSRGREDSGPGGTFSSDSAC